ncbi:MAG: BON domain-containing protein [Nitrospirales bacterium]|nr:BON domain-containing protein [Nitrospirales bacterium]MBA3964430.1 BON domain-containing protein [Nitrospirales bacterium]
MLKSIQAFLSIAVLMGLLAGCQSMSGQTTGEHVDDATVTASVKSKLANQQPSSLSRVEVETVNGVVHLIGVAQTDADKAEAARLAKLVKGVKRVDNDLTVQRQ